MMKFSCLLLFAFSAIIATAQDVSQIMAMADEMLAGTGVSQQELVDRLEEKGIDVNTVSPEDLPALQSTIEQSIAEIQAEKGASTGSGVKETKISQGEDDSEEKEVEEKEPKVEQDEKPQSEEDPENAVNIYGHSIFTDKTIEFYKKSESSSAPDYYVLDVGDKISINIFGQSQADLIYEIESDGFIRPTGMYKVYLKGVPFGKAKDLLYKRFQMAYSFQRGQFNVELNSARTVTVGIYGEVESPGTYTISALNSAISALIAAGGPTENGSIREIQLKNNGKTTEVDVYAFLKNPTNAMNIGLQNNAVIFVPPTVNLVELQGGFIRQGLFELKSNESVEDLVNYAGGVRKGISLTSFNIIRLDDHVQKLSSYTYQSAKSMVLEDLDKVVFRSSKVKYENYVTVQGAVRFTGEFEYMPGMKVADVVQMAVLEDFTRKDIAYVKRLKTDGTVNTYTIKLSDVIANKESDSNMELLPQDAILFFDSREFASSYGISVTGAVREELYDYIISSNDNVRLSDVLNLSKGLKDNATDFGYIVRTSPSNKNEVTYTLVNLKEAQSNPGSERDVAIQPKDSVIVPMKETYSEQQMVRIGGSVRNPGEFVYHEGLTIKDVIIMAGGLKEEAQASRVDVFRVNRSTGVQETDVLTLQVNKDLEALTESDRLPLEPSDVIEVRSMPNYGLIKTVRLEGELKYPGHYAITEDNERILDVIKKAGGITPEGDLQAGQLNRKLDGVGMVITNFSKLNRSSKNNMIVKDGDVIVIPKKHDIVRISTIGTNASNSNDKTLINEGLITVPYDGNLRARKYINTYAGGFDRKARRGKTYVQHASGRMVKARNFGLFRIYPKVTSNSIVLGTMKEEKEEKEKKDRDVYKDVRDFLALATSAVTIIVLANNLK